MLGESSASFLDRSRSVLNSASDTGSTWEVFRNVPRVCCGSAKLASGYLCIPGFPATPRVSLGSLSDWVLPSLGQITVFPTLDLGDLSGRSHRSGFTGLAEPRQTPTSFLGMGIYLCARCCL